MRKIHSLDEAKENVSLSFIKEDSRSSQHLKWVKSALQDAKTYSDKEKNSNFGKVPYLETTSHIPQETIVQILQGFRQLLDVSSVIINMLWLQGKTPSQLVLSFLAAVIFLNPWEFP